MKILIIGSAGFIGKHCFHYLKEIGYEIFGADIIPVSSIPSQFLLDKDNTNFSKIFINNSYDICINASGAASVPFSLENPMLDFDLNTINVFKILEAIRIYNPNCFFINFSSAAIYGNPEKLPVAETMTAEPMSPYGVLKYFAEQICKEYSLYFNIKSCNLRLFSAYGPGLKKQFFWDLLNKFKNDQIIELYGTGKESRDFIYVEDIAKCLNLVIQNRCSLPDILNVASGIQTTISEAAKIFSILLNNSKQINFGGQCRIGDPLNWQADIQILKEIGFEPSFNLEQGLYQYILWLKSDNKIE
jgi:dTDP-glucose 4,6-dehydratase/UDP-glucose 4-epimerase